MPGLRLPLSTHEERLRAAWLAVEGLSVGDAFGRHAVLRPSLPWRYSDDSEMAMATFEVLQAHRHVDQDALAGAFSRRFQDDPDRGYGAMAYWVLHQFGLGRDWRSVSREVFGGEGSLGNGAAMRVAPVGAYFADDLDRVVRQARLSAEVTHAHPDGQAGAIAVALAAAYACARGEAASLEDPRHFFDLVLEHTPDSPTRDGIAVAASLPSSAPGEAARILGDGSRVTSADTVPFSLWCARNRLHTYEGALRAALDGCERKEADRDTVCAIVGSIVVLSTGLDAIPELWRSNREPLTL